MSNIRRYFIQGSPVFITAVCYQRRPYLEPEAHKSLLLSVMREVKGEIPFRMLGYVILDEHFHWLILPREAANYPHIMQSVKLRFSRRLCRIKGDGSNRLWQRRYWDHVIRDAHDLQRHLDYIHINPVKHGVAGAPVDYRWSSFGQYLRRGQYATDWGIAGMPAGLADLVPE